LLKERGSNWLDFRVLIGFLVVGMNKGVVVDSFFEYAPVNFLKK